MDIYDKNLKESAERRGERFISNDEFFSSNSKGCFYEGMERDDNGNWQRGAELRAQDAKREDEQYPCYYCGSKSKSNCCDN